MSVDEALEVLRADDNKRRDEWLKVRQICFYSVAPHSSKIKRPEDLFLIQGEKPESKPQSKRQVKYKMKKAEKWLKNNLE